MNAEDQVPLIEDADTGHKFLIYGSETGVRVDLLYDADSFWASQAQMAAMFGVTQPTISEHIGHIFKEGELSDTEATHRKIRSVRREGARDVERDIDHYDLNVLIAVGYRVGSRQGTMFRIWATDKLFQILTKGFYIDAARLKAPDAVDRIGEVRRILQDIRSDQANVYRELENICAQCQDYDPKSPMWRDFFRATAAKIFFAAAQLTPSEVIHQRADGSKPNMGLTNWPSSKIRKHDVTSAKNYLAQVELDDLNRFTSLLLDFMLDQAQQGKLVMMAQAERQIEEVIRFSGRRILQGGGSVSRSDADAKAISAYEAFNAQRKAEASVRIDALYSELAETAGRSRKPKPRSLRRS